MTRDGVGNEDDNDLVMLVVMMVFFFFLLFFVLVMMLLIMMFLNNIYCEDYAFKVHFCLQQTCHRICTFFLFFNLGKELSFFLGGGGLNRLFSSFFQTLMAGI